MPTAASRRAAGRSIARAAKGEGCKHCPSEDKTPIRSVIKIPRFPAGSFVLFPALSAYTVTRGSGAFWRGA
ncbi:ABC transporter permease [Faecalibacterium prausnitzii]|uniref:ABC transporter permease n=1 Tax=Faecalibacterium prausnitzii TaxID=853 RepID=A0A2A7A177_9FIRM|nr:ABC transporter permease [Faecalibacterium prausnitzii]